MFDMPELIHSNFVLFLMAVFVLSLPFYFTPSIVAFSRRKTNRAPIAVLNLIFGWTLLGWIGALLWACFDKVAVATPMNDIVNVHSETSLEKIHGR